MLEAIVGGMLGAALGILLYRLGWHEARRTPRGNAAATAGTSSPLTPQELYNFLNYDGGEMPKETEQKTI